MPCVENQAATILSGKACASAKLLNLLALSLTFEYDCCGTVIYIIEIQQKNKITVVSDFWMLNTISLKQAAADFLVGFMYPVLYQ